MKLLVGDLLADAAEVNPDGIAVTLGDDWLSYRQLELLARGFSDGLRGVGAGERFVWWCDPDLRSPAGLAAAARRGVVFAPLNPAFSPSELAAVLRYLRPAVVVADASHLVTARSVAEGVAVLGLDDLDKGPNGAVAPRSGPVTVDDTDAHIVYLTSGTTGTPKGVLVSQRASWLRSFPGGSTFASGLHGDGGLLVSFPLFHYGGWHYVLEAWHHRCAFHMCRRFDGPSLVAAARRWQPTGMYCIPAVWNRVLDASAEGSGLESVRHADTGTSAAPPALLERMRAAMPEASTSVMYGSSEGGHHTTLHSRQVAGRPGSVGRVAPPGVIKLSPEGEILYRSPTLMEGYFERAAETASALEGGWYHTGDLGAMDAEGYLWITGRAREVIRTGGESVAPVEVEQALAGLPSVVELAVVGVPDDSWGEIVCLAVVGSAPVSVEAVRSYLGDRLASFKHPRRVVSVDAIPRTPATGQVQRTLLRDLVLEKL
jgi:fatty-acyl-CoA synthase